MKIGILSMQEVPNYGSFLQAFSLKIIFEKRGYEVYFLSIEKGRQVVKYGSSENKRKKIIDKYLFKKLFHYFFYNRMQKIHRADMINYLDIHKKTDYYDAVVIGSDEVFNATTPSPWGFTKQLFGDIDECGIIVSYAASCGTTTYQKVKNLGIENDIKCSLSKMKMISVRDGNTFNFVTEIMKRKPQIHVDPVFLLNYDEYIPDITIKYQYILIYSYPNRIRTENEITAIQAFAKKKGCKIICVGMMQNWCSVNIVADAFALLQYFKKAKYVITDTFHGLVLSIKYNKNFAAFVRDSNKEKIVGLLNQFNMSDRTIHDPKEIESIMNKEPDYSSINSIIALEQKRSYQYFDEIEYLIRINNKGNM